MPEMIKVIGGTFTMGDESGDLGTDPLPTHSVTLKSFSIAKTETTVAQWKAYCTVTGHKMPQTPSWGWKDNDPIVNVNWDDAVGYCDWLSDKTGQKYRLPTEAEFEYAAKGGVNSKGFKYSGGQSLDLVGWYDGNSNNHPHNVATKRANELGLYDMSGNVSEWCKDWYGEYSNSQATNPQDSGTGEFRVLRGGAWSSVPANCRVAFRLYDMPDSRKDDMGFRVASSF